MDEIKNTPGHTKDNVRLGHVRVYADLNDDRAMGGATISHPTQ